MVQQYPVIAENVCMILHDSFALYRGILEELKEGVSKINSRQMWIDFELC